MSRDKVCQFRTVHYRYQVCGGFDVDREDGELIETFENRQRAHERAKAECGLPRGYAWVEVYDLMAHVGWPQTWDPDGKILRRRAPKVIQAERLR